MMVNVSKIKRKIAAKGGCKMGKELCKKKKRRKTLFRVECTYVGGGGGLINHKNHGQMGKKKVSRYNQLFSLRGK